MSWEPRRVVRRREVAALRAEGRAAFEAGRHVQTNPHKYMDAMQWEEGYSAAWRESLLLAENAQPAIRQDAD